MKRPVDWVDPLIDTANRRFFFFSSACRPFGMVNLSPDTVADGAWQAGYRYPEEHVRWFSHVHAWQLSCLPVLPTTGPTKAHLGSDEYRSRFSHDAETVRPGYHALFLEDYGIRAELTATDRVGFHRYTFPESDTAHILFDLGAEVGPSQMSDAHLEQVSPTELAGFVENDATRRRPKPTRIFFAIHLDKPILSFEGWKDGQLLGEIDEISGPACGALVRFATARDEIVHMKVAISYCSVDQARLNLQTELPHWDFDRVREEADQTWNEWLSRIEVEGGTDAQKTKFYTDLYHALLGRRRVSDVDGKYSDMTGTEQVIRQIPLGDDGKPLYEHHNSDALWGAEWTIGVLWPLICPEIVTNFANTFLDYYDNGGLIPRGPSGGNYTFVMTAPTSTPFLVAAYQKGIHTFDIDKAYEGMVRNHRPGGLMSKAGYEHHTCAGGGVEYYIERGYVPLGIQAEAFHTSGAAQTLEYAYCDWCLAQLAAALGKKADCARFTARARNYRSLYDSETGFMRPRNMDGAFVDPFDPLSRDGWVEGNAYHYNWHVPHDVQGLIDLMGGRKSFVNRLDEQFQKAEEHDFVEDQHQGFLDYGNQPSTYIAHLFNYAGAPWLTQKWVRRIVEKSKSGTTPYDGYRGDEDQGLMGALNVLMSIGLFSIKGGCDRKPYYEITSPIFDRVTIHLNRQFYDAAEGCPEDGADAFVIETENNAPENAYIQSATLDGQSLEKPWFFHGDLSRGGILKIVLGSEPNLAWGSRPKDAPPSLTQS